MESERRQLVLPTKLDNTDVPFSNKVRNLGVTFDESLHFKDHISSVFKATFLQLRNLKHIRAHFNRQSFEVLVSAFITSRLDYCNSLLSGLPSSTLRPLSLIQNFAARLIFRQGKFSHVTPLLKELHWLPIPYRIDFKILMLTYKALHSLAPSYLTSLLSPRTCTRTLRSSDCLVLTVPRSHTSSFGDRAFSVYAPRLWNTLPKSLRSAPTLSSFKSLLKTYLFRKAFSSC